MRRRFAEIREQYKQGQKPELTAEEFNHFRDIVARNLEIPDETSNKIKQITFGHNIITGGFSPYVVMEDGERIQLKFSHFVNSNYKKHAEKVRRRYSQTHNNDSQ